MAITRRLLPATLLAVGSFTATAAPGDFATDWGLFGNGRQFVAFDLDALATDQSSDSVVGPDGSVYLAGTVRDANGLQRIGVAKLDPDGQPDLNFSGDGRNTSLQANLVGTAVALHENFLYVAGYDTTDPSDHDMVVCRFSASNGTNLNFPNNGNSNCVSPQFLPDTQDAARAIVVQPDGKFVIAGSIAVDTPTDSYAAFARFEANGQPDTSFGTIQGSNVSLIRSSNIFVRHNIQALTQTTDGGFAAVGSTVVVNSNDLGAVVIRLDSDGTQVGPEFAFASDGSGSRDTILTDVVAIDDPDSDRDYLLIAGSAELTANIHSGLLAMVNSDSDAFLFGFGEADQRTLITLPNASFGFTDLALDGDRSIIALGLRTSGNGLDMVVRRFDVDGIRDDSFGVNGNAIIDFGTPGNTNLPSGLTVVDDAVYASGSILWTAPNYDFAAAKLSLSDALFADGFED